MACYAPTYDVVGTCAGNQGVRPRGMGIWLPNNASTAPHEVVGSDPMVVDAFGT